MPVQDDLTRRLVRLAGAFDRVFEQAMDWAEQDFQEEIKSVKWDWPGTTFRMNGERVESPRDIVDLGGLMRSQKRENIGNDKTTFTWTGALPDGSEEAYALEVHDGYVEKSSGETRLARPFTNNAIQRLPDIVSALIDKEVASNG